MGSDPQLLADMAAFWLAYDAEPDPVEKRHLEKLFLLAHGATRADVHNVKKNESIGDIRGGLAPVRVP